MANSPPTKLTPEILLAFRKSLGYSQRVFGIRLAEINDKERAYTRGYISNLETGKQLFTEDVEKAMRNFLEIAQNPLFSFIENLIKHHPGKVAANSTYGGSSKLCKWPDCDHHFIPTSPNQKQCPQCKRRRRKL